MRQFAKKEVSEDCRAAVRFILSRNIVCGNALSLKKVDENGNDTDEPIIFSEWAFVTGSKMQRKDFRFDKLLAGEYEPPAKKKQEAIIRLVCLTFRPTTKANC